MLTQWQCFFFFFRLKIKMVFTLNLYRTMICNTVCMQGCVIPYTCILCVFFPLIALMYILGQERQNDSSINLGRPEKTLIFDRGLTYPYLPPHKLTPCQIVNFTRWEVRYTRSNNFDKMWYKELRVNTKYVWGHPWATQICLKRGKTQFTIFFFFLIFARGDSLSSTQDTFIYIYIC